MKVNTITITLPLPADEESGKLSNEEFDARFPARVLVDGEKAIYPCLKDDHGRPLPEENPEFVKLPRGKGAWETNLQVLHSLAYVGELGALKAMRNYLRGIQQVEALRSIFGDKLPFKPEDIMRGNVNIDVVPINGEEVLEKLLKGFGKPQAEPETAPDAPKGEDDGKYGKLV